MVVAVWLDRGARAPPPLTNRSDALNMLQNTLFGAMAGSMVSVADPGVQSPPQPSHTTMLGSPDAGSHYPNRPNHWPNPTSVYVLPAFMQLPRPPLLAAFCGRPRVRPPAASTVFGDRPTTNGLMRRFGAASCGGWRLARGHRPGHFAGRAQKHSCSNDVRTEKWLGHRRVRPGRRERGPVSFTAASQPTVRVLMFCFAFSDQ